LPATPPSDGDQYAFEVDLDRCSGCKSCVAACHSLNGLDEGESFRDVGLLVGGGDSDPFLQHVTAACHHCLEPACLIACPVDAYEKNLTTGIVKHLDDQCIGCRYCTLACPYDVPKYHHRLGIVRKCDMCSTRLAVGEAPACVQSCPSEAIAIRLASTRQIVADCETSNFLPAAPDPRLTLPTTTYKTSRVFPRSTLPADYHRVVSQHSHWPLIVMLVLTQMSVGAFAVGLALEQTMHFEHVAGKLPLHTAASAFFGLLAIGASVLHLGRPLYAFRAVIGLSHSWLSREIVAFGLFAVLACAYACSMFFFDMHQIRSQWPTVLGWAVVASGFAGILSSTMIYSFTGRAFWSTPRTGARFLLTSAQLGIAAGWLTLVLPAALARAETADVFVAHATDVLCRGLIAVTVVKLAIEAADFRHLASRYNTALKRSAKLITGELSSATLARFACGFLGGIAMPLFLIQQAPASENSLPLLIAVAMLFAACLTGELLERYLFFRAVAAPRMPGELRR
jgi:Fe-S-cluster-containing dehydrogenase component/DMSO reductase anchor subunit